MKKVYRFLLYVVGMLILASGLSLSTKLNLGVSALMSLPFMISDIYKLNFGDITLIYYIILILIEIIIHISSKKYKSIINDILQFVLSLFFTRVLNVFGNIFFAYEGIFIVRILIFLVSILLIGIGATITIDTKLVPNPADGLVATIAEKTKKEVGNVKNVCDISSVCLTIIISLLLSKKIIGVGLGTLISMILVGRVIHVFNIFYGKEISKLVK